MPITTKYTVLLVLCQSCDPGPVKGPFLTNSWGYTCDGCHCVPTRVTFMDA